MRLFLAAAVVVVLSGCGQTPPTLAGGKPVGYWVRALQDPDARLRQKAAAKLGNVGPADAAVLPALLGALEDRDPGVRCEAMRALVKFGPEAGEAVPILTAMRQRDRDARVRAHAAQALRKLQGPAGGPE
jgi:HEAT repeat protein